MSEHEKHSAFLKSLLTCDDNAEHHGLQERISRAERDEHCLGCACRLVSLIALLALAGLGYCAVLLPEFFQKARHFYVQVFSALALASVLCLTAFIGLWLWYRSIVNRLHDEGRKFIAALVQSRSHRGPAAGHHRDKHAASVHPLQNEDRSASPDNKTLRKAS